ncbi:MAG: protease B nonderepressible form [Pycnora praestabilis]|nr:MAG: protease B nonderepressible form [Pycnora praestabilis]
MRQRITFLHQPEDAFNQEQLQVTGNTLSVKSLKAAREYRITFGFHELPQELALVLKQCHEVHFRWTSPYYYLSIAPFISRTSPGLHVFFTPQRNAQLGELCSFMRKLFGQNLNCQIPEKSFTHSPILSDRFSHASAFQFYQLLPTLKDLVTYIQQNVCSSTDPACHARASSLNVVSYLDIDFDTISQGLVFNAFWESPSQSGHWNEDIDNVSGKDKVEVGVLANERPTEPEELSLGGFLTVVGEDDNPSPTLFSFPARHHPLPPSILSTFTTTFSTPIGLHPTLRLTFPTSPLPFTPPTTSCALHTYLTLPSYLFADKYQLSDPLFLSSKNLAAIRSLSGETDLEAPDWVVDKWGSSMLVELVPPSSAESTKDDWTADIPLHLRYLPPAAGGIADVEVPWPVVFWACNAQEGLKMAVNPFDRVNLGYDGLFGPRTMFYHFSPDAKGNGNGNGSLIETIQVPVLDLERVRYVEVGTVGVVLLGFAWVCWRLLRVINMAEREVRVEKKRD